MSGIVETDIVVAGAGPVGLIAARALAAAGFRVVLAGPRMAPGDLRTTALMAPALSFLEGLGVSQRIVDAAAPLRTMRIVDATGRLLRSPPVTFRAAEIGEPWFGLNVPNVELHAALAEAVSADPAIRWDDATVSGWQLDEDAATATLSTGATVRARLAVAADGRNSAARDAAGIAVRRRELPQAALVANIVHARPHEDISTEFHTPTGPFTQVPLPGVRRSSIVWVVSPETSAELAAAGDADLARRIEERMDSMLGAVELAASGRQVFPLVSVSPSTYGTGRVALVGEAAHVFPPIGAQGLNLGIRDVEEIVATAERFAADPGAPAALSAYGLRRGADILARAGGVNLLNRSLLSDLLPAQLARSAGLGALGAFAPLRAFFMREGLRPGAGLRGFAADLREKVGR